MGGAYPGFRTGILNNASNQIEVSIAGDRTGRMTVGSTLNVWYNFVITCDKSIAKTYLNGVLKASASTNTCPASNTNVNIGRWINSSTYTTKYMTACRIYDRILTDEEIIALDSEFTPTP